MGIPRGEGMNSPSMKGEEKANFIKKNSEAIENNKLLIEQTNRQIGLVKAKLELMIENPKPLKPGFEFEDKPEWQEFLIKQWQFDCDTQEHALMGQIELYEEQINKMETQNKNLIDEGDE